MTEILILDYNREADLVRLLYSLKEKANFEKRVVVLNNGGEKYADKYLKDGVIDEVIHNKDNVGSGGGTIQLFARCQSEYAFYIQVDQSLNFQVKEENVTALKELADKNLYVDLAGDQCSGIPSERAGFWKTYNYNKIPKTVFGVGPLDHEPWSEFCVQDYFRENKETMISVIQTVEGDSGQMQVPLFKDCGKTSVRENPDGSRWSHFPDAKTLFCLKAPKVKFNFPKLSDEEWEIAMKGEWPEEGKVPDAWKKDVFEVWNKKL